MPNRPEYQYEYKTDEDKYEYLKTTMIKYEYQLTTCLMSTEELQTNESVTLDLMKANLPDIIFSPLMDEDSFLAALCGARATLGAN